MNKKIIIIILLVISIIILGIVTINSLMSKPKQNKVENQEQNEEVKLDTELENALSVITDVSSYKKSDFEYISKEGTMYKFLNKKISDEIHKSYFIIDVQSRTYEVETITSVGG